MYGKDLVPQSQLILRVCPEQNSDGHRGCDETLLPSLLGPSSTPSSLRPPHQLTTPDYSPSELPSLSVWLASTCGPGPAIAVVTDAARHPE